MASPRPSLLLLPFFFLFFFFFVTATATAASDEDEEALTAYQALEQYDFPVGILPKGVLGYELDRATGKFTARFKATCSFSLEGSYQLRYRPTVSGVISRGRIRNLSGVSVKVLLFWLNIVEVDRVGDQLDFSVGIASASFTVDSFAESPQCGCGFDCGGDGADDDDVRRRRPSFLVSSS